MVTFAFHSGGKQTLSSPNKNPPDKKMEMVAESNFLKQKIDRWF